MSTIAGTNTYAIAISTTTSLGSPSGTILYINAENVKPSWKLTTKIDYQPAKQSFSLRTGEKSWSITITNCRIRSDVAAANVMTELNAITEFIEDSTDTGVAPSYLFIGNRGLNGSYTPMKFRDNTGTDQVYLRGYITSFTPQLEGMVNYVIATLKFDECWL